MTLSPSCLQFTNWVAQTPANNMEYLFTICTNGHKKNKKRKTVGQVAMNGRGARALEHQTHLTWTSWSPDPKHPKHKTGTERNSSTTVTICNQHSLCRFLQWIMNFKFCDPIHFRNRHQDLWNRPMICCLHVSLHLWCVGHKQRWWCAHCDVTNLCCLTTSTCRTSRLSVKLWNFI